MKTFSTPEEKEIYKQLRSQTGSYYEVKIIRGTGQNMTTYGMDKLKRIRVKPALFENDGPQIGGVHSAQCEVKLLEASAYWPRMSEFDVQIRLVEPHDADAQEYAHSEWFSMGTYYTDERKADKYGNLSLIAFDEMLTLEQSWTDKIVNAPNEWPVTSQKAAELICEATGIEIDSMTVLDDETPYIGFDTKSTARDVMRSIAVGNGGNWFVTSDGKYRLIRLKNVSANSSAVAGLAIAGIAVVGKNAITTVDEGIAYVDMSVANIDFSDSLEPVTGVEIKSPEGTVAFAGSRSGYVIKAECDYADTAIAELCLSKVDGYVYFPFEAKAARIDPISEVGDYVYIADATYPIVTLDWNIAPKITANLSAPFEEEVDHEYRTTSEAARAYQKSVKYTDDSINYLKNTYIRQTAESIVMGAMESYVDNDKFNNELREFADSLQNGFYDKEEINQQYDAISTQFAQMADAFEANIITFKNDVNNEISAVKSYITYKLMTDRQGNTDVGTVVIGVIGNNTSIRITSDEIGLYYGDECISYWNQDQQLTPKALEIPVGGKFTLGSIMFKPRVSGNMSLMWVGEENGN